MLHHLVGLSVDEVGAELHAPSGTVKSWLSRGRASRARTLDRDRGGPDMTDDSMTKQPGNRCEAPARRTPAAHWLGGPPTVVRRTAVIRRRRRMAGGIGAVVVAAASLAIATHNDPRPHGPATASDRPGRSARPRRRPHRLGHAARRRASSPLAKADPV